MKCLKLIFCLLYFCCSLAEAKEVQVDAQKEVDEMTGRLVASYLEAKVDEEHNSGLCECVTFGWKFSGPGLCNCA